jgi:hypothetical protein
MRLVRYGVVGVASERAKCRIAIRGQEAVGYGGGSVALSHSC